MNTPLTRRDAIYAQIFDDMDALIKRAEGLGPHLQSLGDDLLNGLEFYDTRIAELTAEAQTNAMTYIVRRIKETADASVSDQVVSIETAVGTLFDEKIAPRVDRLIEAVDAAADRAGRARARAWLMHGAVAIAAAVLASVTTVVTFVVVMPLPGK
jgi:lysophospholipase L1-like esterase